MLCVVLFCTTQRYQVPNNLLNIIDLLNMVVEEEMDEGDKLLPVRDFLISRIHKYDGVQLLRDVLTSEVTETSDVVLSSIGDAKFNSFKLSLSVDDAEKVMDPFMWGRACVRVERGESTNNKHFMNMNTKI